MSNIYSTYTAEASIPCTREQFLALRRILSADRGLEAHHGFSVEYNEGSGVYLFAEDSGNPDNLPPEFLRALGDLISASGREFLEVGGAFTCDRPKQGSHGGDRFRIMADGRALWPQTIWPK